MHVPEIVIKKRIYSQRNMDQFLSCIQDKNWDHILLNYDAQHAYTLFHNDFRHMYDTCFPVRIIKPGYKTRKPWLSEGMKNSIRIKK